MSCLAVSSLDMRSNMLQKSTRALSCSPPYACRKFEARGLTSRNELGKEKKIKPGSHAFVAMEGEPFIRVSVMAAEFGAAAGHPQLGKEEPVLYAGEVEFDEAGSLTRWSNMSGTYRCHDAMSYQANLPLDKFYAVLSNEPQPEVQDFGVSIRTETASGVWLHKILSFSEEEFTATHNQWAAQVQGLLEQDPAAMACHAQLQGMTTQLCEAIDRYGFLTEV
jgi:hypothetical protein